jgi:Ca-activated chloride channel family protein
VIFRFASPLALVLLLAVAGAAWWAFRGRLRAEPRLVLPRAGARLAVGRSFWVRLERALPVARIAALILLVGALARPQAGARVETVTSHGVDVVVALDVSSSMRAEDFKPHNRLEVARRTVREFVDGRPQDRLGLVVFAGLATTRSPLTLDHAMLRQMLEEVTFAPREQDGTAIGMGLAVAVHRLRQSDAKSKVVVLVTDGRNNKGQIGPEAAAEAARALGVRVHTIGVGTEGEAPIPMDFGPLGRRYMMQRVDLDEPLLRHVASATGGRYFRATDAQGLAQIFATIDAMEKSEVESPVRVLYTELFPWVLVPALALLLGERALRSTRLRRIP